MPSSRWSILLLGSILATTATGSALGDDAAPAAAPTRQQVTVGSTSDLLIDPAVLAAATASAARAGEAVAEELVDPIRTGSITPLTPGPRTGGLTEIRAPQTGGLSEPKAAPEPAPEPAPKKLGPSSEATPAVAPMPVADAAGDAGKPGDAAAAPIADTTTVVAATPAPTDASPAPAEVASMAPAVEAPIEPTADTAPAAAPATPVEAAVETPAVATTAAAEAPAAAVETASAAPAPAEAAPVVARPAEASPTSAPAEAAPMMASIEAIPGGASYATASEPTKPAAAPVASAPVKPAAAPEPATPALVPSPASTSSVTAAPAVAAPAASAPVAANPAAPVVAPAAVPSTDAAIAATLVAEQAAAALKATLEDLQPRAGSAEERADRAAILAFYADRAFLPLFVDAQGTTDRARSARVALMRADRDGLDPQDYALPQIGPGLSPQAKAEAEYAHARTVVRFARHLQTGRFDPRRVHELVTPDLTRTEARDVLTRVAGTTAVAEALEAYAPPHEGYRRLRAMLAELRATGEEQPMVMVPVGPLLKPGQKDARVAVLRERLGIAGVVSDAEVFDPALAEAVMAFQRDRGLSPTGKVGRETVTALNEEKTGTAARISDVISNMERWRWLPRDLGELYVFVNTADFHLDVMKDGQSIHHAKVIVGKPSNPTPIFSEEMRHVVVNPYWNVPYSIVKKEMIGKAQSTAGGALSRGGWEVEVGRQRVDPTTVDWSTVDASKVTIRQRPGDGNALGNIKFLFPNQHAVYLHDTSSRGLFAQKFRALSHGCVRVHEPFSFADAVLSEEPEKIDGAKLKKMIGGGEKTINLKRLVPVHITYFTAWVDDAGQLQTRPDFYGHDARVKRLLEM